MTDLKGRSMNRIMALAVGLAVAGCGGGEADSDIGANAPPVEFQAACFRLPRGAVVSFTHTPTLGVVLRHMTLKPDAVVRWEAVSGTSYIQRIEMADPLTGKTNQIGFMYDRLSAQPSDQCPNGTVGLTRMVANGEEQTPAAIVNFFTDIVDITALNAPQGQAAPTAQPVEDVIAAAPQYRWDREYTAEEEVQNSEWRSTRDRQVERAAQICRAVGNGAPTALQLAEIRPLLEELGSAQIDEEYEAISCLERLSGR